MVLIIFQKTMIHQIFLDYLSSFFGIDWYARQPSDNGLAIAKVEKMLIVL